MRRVVVFIGGSRDYALTFQRAVADNLSLLRQAGVVVPETARRMSNLNGLTHQPLASVGESGWTALREEVAGVDGDTVLLVVPALLRVTNATARRQWMVGHLAALADEVVVVSVVADQLTLINDYYVNQVATWRTSGRLAEVGPRICSNDLFSHERLLRPWYEDPSVRYVALPAPQYTAGNPLHEVLAAAGVQVGERLSNPAAVRPTLGPAGVEANRLLATYLRAEIADFDPQATPVVAAGRQALARAEKLGWCADPFWGWTPHGVDQMLVRFEASNTRFAQTVWDTGWQLPYPIGRRCTQVDFLDLDANDVDQIQIYVTSTARRVTRQLATAR